MIGEQYWIEIPAIFGLAILLGVISFTGKPNLWGRWESFTFFHAFAPAKFKYKLTIPSRGNIGGQGYLTLECARWVCDRFGWSFRNARLPVIVAGWISLVFLFMTCQLWFGFWPALIVTAFCGVNRLFFLFQHQLIVAMPTYTSIMGIVYFISAAHYDGNIFYVWNAVGMGLFLCGCLAHYGPGRLTGIALWTYSLIGSIALHRISFSIGYLPVASLIISLLFFMPGGAMNFKTLFNKHYIFPPGTDVTFSSKSLSATILLNLKIIGEFISPIRSKRFSWSFMYGSYSAYVHSFTWLHLVLLALGACVFWFSVNCYIIGVFTLLFLSLLIPCAISAWYENNIPTLSNFRLFYLTMPMFLLMGCGLKWLFAFHILPLTLIVGLICAFTFAFDIQNLFREMKDFEGATIQLAGMTPLMLENTLAKMDETSPKEEEYQGIDHLHMFQQLVLLAKSKQIRDAIDKWDKSSKRLLMLPSFDLDQKSSLPYFLDIPHSLLFLVFYLQDLKIPCACLQLFDTRISGARIINGSGYIGAPRLFPIRWDNLNMNNITETTNLIVRPERDDCQNLFIASHVIEQECVQLTFPDIVSETLS